MFGRVLLAFSALTFAQAASAQNLSPTSVALSAGDLAGGPGHLRATVQVSGAVGSFGWRAYASSTGAIRGSVLIGSFGPVSASPGAQQLEQDVTLPATLGGSYFVAIEVDPTNAVPESNELDNAFVSATRVRIHAPQSDLRVSSVSLAATQGRVGEAANVDATIENRGQLPATFDLAAFISPDDAVTPNDPELGQITLTLAPGEARRVHISGTVPASLTPGDYVVGVWADPAGSTREVDALDNLGLAGSRFTTYEDQLSLDTVDLPGGTVFISYYALLAASGGDGSYRYGVSHGRLPSGLRLDAATGRIAGIPLESGRHELSIEVRSNGLVAEKMLRMEVAQSGVELQIATPALEDGTLGLPYEANLVAAGGEPPYVWTLLSGTFPPGIDSATDGSIRGVPTQEGSFTVHLQVADALGGRIDTELTIHIGAANIVVLTTNLTPLPVGEAIDIELVSSGGAAPVKWEALSAPPPGLTITEEGHLTGTPSSLGQFAVRVRVSDSSRNPRSDTALVQIRVEDSGTFEIHGAELPSLALRERLNATLTLSGGTAPFQWRVGLGDGLPEGFKMEQQTDGSLRISGASIRPIDSGATVVVRDAAGRERTALLSFHVDPAVRSAASGCSSAGASASSLLPLAMLGLVLAFRRRRLS